jgi:hypothetical protein
MASARAPAPATVKPACFGGLGDLDAAVSLRLHALFLPAPRLLLKALEVAGDGRIWLPVPISLLLLSATPASSGELSPLLVGLVAGLVLDLVLVGLAKVVVRRPLVVPQRPLLTRLPRRRFSLWRRWAPAPGAALFLGGCDVGVKGAPWPALRSRRRGWGLPRRV